MTNEYIENLNRRYGIKDKLSFHLGEGDMPVALIDNGLCEAEISLYGGHVLSFIPNGEEDLLWVSSKSIYSEGTPIRGGIPVCWPWFNAHPTDSDVYSHGFARRNTWEVMDSATEEDGSTVILLALNGDKNTRKGWPHSYHAELTITAGEELKVELTTENKGDEPIVISNALHTYFSVADATKIIISGLDGCEYGDDVDSGKMKVQSGDITIAGEVDRNYRNTEDECIITDPLKDRKIRVRKEGSSTTVVWNPWVEKAKGLKDFGDEEYMNMVCIEAVNAFDDCRKIEPGENHTMGQIISIA